MDFWLLLSVSFNQAFSDMPQYNRVIKVRLMCAHIASGNLWNICFNCQKPSVEMVSVGFLCPLESAKTIFFATLCSYSLVLLVSLGFDTYLWIWQQYFTVPFRPFLLCHHVKVSVQCCSAKVLSVLPRWTLCRKKGVHVSQMTHGCHSNHSIKKAIEAICFTYIL